MQRTLFTGIDSNFHSKFTLKMCVILLLQHKLNETVKMIVSYYIIYTNHFHRPGIKGTISKTNNFSIVTSICPKYYRTQLSCAKNSC